MMGGSPRKVTPPASHLSSQPSHPATGTFISQHPVCAVSSVCFPADAQLRRLNKGTAAWETVAIEQLAIGNSVECLKPTDAGDGTITGFTPGVCDVYYYVNTKKVLQAACAGNRINSC